MAVQYDIPYTFVGNGVTAVVGPQNLSDPNYVGIPDSITRVVEVRESVDNVVEGDGAVQGNNYFGRAIWTFGVLIDPSLGSSVNSQFDKLNAATASLRADGTLTWTETGRAQTRSLYRRQVWTPADDKRPHKVFFALSCANYRAEAATATTSGVGTLANAGNTPAPPVFTLTSPTNTITLTKSSPSPSETLTLNGLSGAGTVTVDFLARTVTTTSGTSPRPSAVVFPSSVWWQLQPGNNTVSVSGATVSGSGISWRSSWL